MSTTTTSSGMQGRVTLPGVGRDVENVLLWRDIRVSGIAFAAGTFLYFLLEWSGYSLLTLLANTALAGLALAFLWNTVARFTGKTASTPAFTKPVNEGDVKALAQQLTILFNKGLALGNRLISGQDVFLTGQVAVALYIISKIGRYFSSLGLLYTLFVLAFTLPKLYEWKKDDIDSSVAYAHKTTSQAYHQNVKPYLSSIPRASGASSARSSGATSGTTQPTAAGRAGGLTGDTATSGTSATLSDKLGAGNTGSGYEGGSGSGGQGGFTDTRDGYGQPKPSSYGQSGSGNYQSGGSGGNYQSGGAGTGGGNYSNEPLNPGVISGQGNTQGGYQGSYVDAARDTAQQLRNKVSDLGGQSYEQTGARNNY